MSVSLGNPRLEIQIWRLNIQCVVILWSLAVTETIICISSWQTLTCWSLNRQSSWMDGVLSNWRFLLRTCRMRSLLLIWTGRLVVLVLWPTAGWWSLHHSFASTDSWICGFDDFNTWVLTAATTYFCILEVVWIWRIRIWISKFLGFILWLGVALVSTLRLFIVYVVYGSKTASRF